MKLALVENLGSDFFGARLRFALFLQKKGIDVIAIIPNDGYKNLIEKEGIKVITIGNKVRGNSLKNKFLYAKELKKVLIEYSFDIVHFYRLQPNIIGTFIAGVYTDAKIVNHVTGLGIVFSDKTIKKRILKFITKALYKFNYYLFQPNTIFQNEYDSLELGLSKRIIVIQGSAVNEDKFCDNAFFDSALEKNKLDIPEKNIVFIFVSRLIKEKGIFELVEGCKLALKHNQLNISLLIVGGFDVDNPSSISENDLKEKISDYESIKFLGKSNNVEKLIAISDVAILPTYYREGTPRFLLEAMSIGKAIITTKMPGCDHLVESGNGLLIKPKDILAIKESMLDIVKMDIDKMGKLSSKLYQQKFSEKKVYNSILNFYNKINSD